jgi:hypothetical protein
MERAGRATWTVEPRGSGERVGERNEFKSLNASLDLISSAVPKWP